ncbi:hypothetical protein [Thermoactinomyces mirandus]|nr:hypothetical protein [Thermoactinomyces mirandus]
MSAGCGNEQNADSNKKIEEKAAEETVEAVEPNQSCKEIGF